MEQEAQNILTACTRGEFRQRLAEHGEAEGECWVRVKHGKPVDEAVFWYLDAVEEALCFGWIEQNV